MNKTILTLLTTAVFYSPATLAWYGPQCFPATTRSLILTLPSMAGEAPGDIQVEFDDNSGIVKLGPIRPSPKIKNAHEIELTRDANSALGTFAVILTNRHGTPPLKYEFEFKKDATDCGGAIVRTTSFSNSNEEETPKKPKKKRTVPASTPSPSPSPAPSPSAEASPAAPVSATPSPNAEPSPVPTAAPSPTPIATSSPLPEATNDSNLPLQQSPEDPNVPTKGL